MILSMSSPLIAQVRNAPEGILSFVGITGLFVLLAWYFISKGIEGVRDRRLC